MDSVTLADLRARRDALNEKIAKVEANDREAWNAALWACEDTLSNWLQEHRIEYSGRDRKNVTTWDIGHGALIVDFATDEDNYGRGLRMVSGGTLTLEWSVVPDPERMLAVVAVLLNRPGPS